jgi:hypothetical protein
MIFTFLNVILALTAVFCFGIVFNSSYPANFKGGFLAFRIFPIFLGIAALCAILTEVGILYVELNMPYILR